MRLRGLLRASRLAAAVAVVSLLSGGLPAGHGNSTTPQWQGPVHEAVLANASAIGRANALLAAKPPFHPHHTPAACSADAFDASRSRLVLRRTRPGCLRPAPRLLHRVSHADGDPPA